MSTSPRRNNAVTAIERGSPRDRVAQALYDFDAGRSTRAWHPWRLTTRPKRLLYLDRAAVVLTPLKPSDGA